MKKIMLSIGLAAVCVANALAGETLQLKLAAERSLILRDSPQDVVVKIDLTAIPGARKHHHTPLNLCVVIDKSGSMEGPKLEKTKQAARQLVDNLTSNDYFSLVSFSDQARILVDAQKVADKDALKEQIDGIRADGSTALYAGVRLGAAQVREFFSDRRINRIILLSDGLANVGPSSPRALGKLGGQLSEDGISVTTIGVGDDYNEDLMATLAQASDANYYYVKDTEKLPEIFAKELGGLMEVAAREVRIEITCPDGVQPLGFIGRGERFEGQKATVKLSQFTAGQNRYLLLRCRANGPQPEIARVHATYTDELNGGTTDSKDDTVKVQFTADGDASDRSANAGVITAKELMLTAVAKDEALAQADAGNYQAAAQILSTQNSQLQKAYANAPAALQSQLQGESENLTDYSSRLNDGKYDNGSRKALQWQSYNTRNSK